MGGVRDREAILVDPALSRGRCQKFTGSPFAPDLAAKRSLLRWIRDEELTTLYEAPLRRALSHTTPTRCAMMNIFDVIEIRSLRTI